MRLLNTAVLSFLGVAACPLAPALAVPAAEYSVTLNQGVPFTTPGLFSFGGVTGENGPLPSPYAIAHVFDAGTSHVSVHYWFRVNGPPNAAVPIHIDGRVQLSAGGALFEEDMIWGLSARLSVQAFDRPFDDPEHVEVDGDSDGIDCNPNSVGPIPVPLPIPTCPATIQDEPVLLTLNAVSGGDNRVVLFASANNQEAFTADFETIVDPVISFAPGFDSTGYSIELSEGVGNAVPEPGGALLTSAGAGVLLLLRRKKPPRE